MRLRESGPYSQRGMYLIKDITVFLDGEHGGKIGEEVDRDLQCVREQSQQSYEWHTRRTQGNFSLLKMHPLQQRRVCIIIVVSGAIARFPSKSQKISYKPDRCRRNFSQPQTSKNLLRKWSRFCKNIL